MPEHAERERRRSLGGVGPHTPGEHVITHYGDVSVTRHAWWRVELVRLPSLPNPCVRLWRWVRRDYDSEPTPSGGIVLTPDVAERVLSLMARAARAPAAHRGPMT